MEKAALLYRNRRLIFMSDIKTGIVSINDRIVQTSKRVVDMNEAVIRVEAGTNGLRFGEREGGGRVYFSLEGLKGDFLPELVKDRNGDVTGIELSGCGDSPLMALISALKFATATLEDQMWRE